MNSTTSCDYDLIIIGAGAAGLSLLLALDHANYRGSVKILERGNGPTNDRIWSFWHNHNVPSYLTPIITRQWQKWQITAQGKSYQMSDKFHRYCAIRSESLANLAIERIKATTCFDIQFNCEVTSVEHDNQCAKVCTGDTQLTSYRVVDTRPPLLQEGQSDGLFQCFYGQEVVTKEDFFDPDWVKLMDQLTTTELGVEFVYVLPFSARHALIEFTCFSPKMISQTRLKANLARVLDELLDRQDYTVEREESAVLPLYSVNLNQGNYRSPIIYGGIAGGAMRASTGYSFLACQRWAKQCAEELFLQDQLSANTPISPCYQWMDKLMLKVLRNDLQLGQQIFVQMFKQLKAPQFVRFMTEQATFCDIVRVIWAMPKIAFMQALFSRKKNLADD